MCLTSGADRYDTLVFQQEYVDFLNEHQTRYLNDGDMLSYEHLFSEITEAQEDLEEMTARRAELSNRSITWKCEHLPVVLAAAVIGVSIFAYKIF